MNVTNAFKNPTTQRPSRNPPIYTPYSVLAHILSLPDDREIKRRGSVAWNTLTPVLQVASEPVPSPVDRVKKKEVKLTSAVRIRVQSLANTADRASARIAVHSHSAVPASSPQMRFGSCVSLFNSETTTAEEVESRVSWITSGKISGPSSNFLTFIPCPGDHSRVSLSLETTSLTTSKYQYLSRTSKWARVAAVSNRSSSQNSSQSADSGHDSTSGDALPSITALSLALPVSPTSSRIYSVVVTIKIYPAISLGTTLSSQDVTTINSTSPIWKSGEIPPASGFATTNIASNTPISALSIIATSPIMTSSTQSAATTKSAGSSTMYTGSMSASIAFSTVNTAPGGVPSISTTIVLTEIQSSAPLSFPLSTTTIDVHPTTFLTSTASITITRNGSLTSSTIISSSHTSAPMSSSTAVSNSSVPSLAPNVSMGHGKSLEIGLPIMFAVALPLCITIIFLLYRRFCPRHYASTEKYCPIRRTTKSLRRVFGKMKVTRLQNRAIRARSESDKAVESFREWMLQRKQWEKDNASVVQEEKPTRNPRKRGESNATTRASTEHQNSLSDPGFSTFAPSSPSWPLPSPTSFATRDSRSNQKATSQKLKKAHHSIDTTDALDEAETKYQSTLAKLQRERALRIEKLRSRRDQEELPNRDSLIQQDRDASVTTHIGSGESDSSFERLEQWWHGLGAAGVDDQNGRREIEPHMGDDRDVEPHPLANTHHTVVDRDLHDEEG